jgi:hypothetical protein
LIGNKADPTKGDLAAAPKAPQHAARYCTLPPETLSISNVSGFDALFGNFPVLNASMRHARNHNTATRGSFRAPP